MDIIPNVLDKLDLHQAKYSITSAIFEQWKKSFKKMNAIYKSKKFPDGRKMVPIGETLTKVRKITIVVSNHECLVQNLFYACFQAQHATDQDSDSAAKARLAYKDKINMLPEVVAKIKSLLSYLKSNRDLASIALKYSDMSSMGTEELKVSRGCDSPRVLESLLVRLAEGLDLMQTPDHPGLMDIPTDYACGPLLLFDSNVKDPSTGKFKSTTRVFATGRKLEAIELGLIFHLTYILRYFTGKRAEEPCQSKIKEDGELTLTGRILDCGRPHNDIVAHLFNATFKMHSDEACSGEDVRQKLKDLLNSDLYRLAKEKNDTFSGVEFYGWELDLEKIKG